jgi:hypothetical protein
MATMWDKQPSPRIIKKTKSIMDRHWRRRIHRLCVSDLSGPCAHQRLAEEAEEMRREEPRTLHDNVYLLDDHRR